jgi:deoxyribose-phosphate aldolase
VPDVVSARRIRALIDLTDLGPACTEADIERLCRRAIDHHPCVAAVCVWPPFVARAARLLAGTGVKVATVVNFPGGGTDVAATLAETALALSDGADEIDLVIPFRALLAGDAEAARAMVVAVRAAVPAPKHLKVILETGSYPSQREVRAAADLAIDAGADFVKTSTGKTDRSATPEAARTLLEAIRDAGRAVGLKPSGGIRNVADAEAYLALADEVMGPQWAVPATFRFGASGLLDAVDATIDAASSELG